LESKVTPAPSKIAEGFDEEELVALIAPDAPAVILTLQPDRAAKFGPVTKLFVTIPMLPPGIAIRVLPTSICGATKASSAVPVLSNMVPRPVAVLDETKNGAK
jgi:hypothetical protein